MKKLLILIITLSLVASATTPANAYEFQIDSLASSTHDGSPTLEFAVSGTTATTFNSCEALLRVNPVLRIFHDKGSETLLLSAPWGTKVETLKVTTNGLNCRATAMERSQYRFASGQTRVVHDIELVFGKYSKTITGVTMLNRDFTPTAPTITSPVRASNVSDFMTLRFGEEFHKEFRVTSLELEICKVSSVCFSAPNVVSLATDGMSADVIFDAESLKGQSIEVALTWWFTNELGRQGYVTRKLVLNSSGANSAFKPTAGLLSKFPGLSFVSEPMCRVVKTKATCTVRPEFRAKMRSASNPEQLLPIPFSTTAVVQTSTDMKNWKTVGKVTIDTRKTASFKVPMQLGKESNYIRVTPSGIRTKPTWDILVRNFDY